jgi:WD40 repeat protein
VIFEREPFSRRLFLTICARLGSLALVARPSLAQAASPGRKGSMTAKLSGKTTFAEAQGQLVAYHPDGRRWATAFAGSSVSLWNDDEKTATFAIDFAGTLAFSQNGQKLFAGAQRIDLASNSVDPLAEPLSRTLDTAVVRYELVAAAFAPDGKELVVAASYSPPRGLRRKGSEDAEKRAPAPQPAEQILLLNGTSRRLHRRLWAGDAMRCQTVAIHPRFVAAADVEVWVWRRDRNAKPRILKGLTATASCVGISPDGKLVAAVDLAGMLAIWDTETGSRWALLQAHNDCESQLAFHPALALLATGGRDNKLRFWSLDEGSGCVGSLEEEGPIEGLAFSPNGRHLLATLSGRPTRFDFAA